MADLNFTWESPASAAEAARFAASILGGQPSYISHGEIQTGLSPDGSHWAADLVDLLAADFAEPGDRDMLVGRDASNSIRALLILAWEASKRRAFAVIEDMVVDPASRGQGIGSTMLAMAHARVTERGVEWVFLESGLGNSGAHRFFEREGFEKTGHVFARRLA